MTVELPIYQVDAFTSEVFGGNPAAVCPLETWLDDEVMQAIAIENNLSETAFYVPGDEDYHLRWFTPAREVDLCGHATLATGYVITTYLQPGLREVAFRTRSGRLLVTREKDLFTLDFPALSIDPLPKVEGLDAALGAPVVEYYTGMDVLAVLIDEDSIRGLKPDMTALAAYDVRGIIVTAPGRDCDFVSRFFAPRHGIPEDPVTGSAHCSLTPYWAKRLGKSHMTARQLSARGGELRVELRGDRVLLSGQAAPYMTGTIRI